MKGIKNFFKKITLRRMLILIFLLMFNSYAWFIYATKVFNSVTTTVAAWEVKFHSGETEVVNTVAVNIPVIYPGMEEFTEEITATNLGEKDAVLTFAIREIKILR